MSTKRVVINVADSSDDDQPLSHEFSKSGAETDKKAPNHHLGQSFPATARSGVVEQTALSSSTLANELRSPPYPSQSLSSNRQQVHGSGSKDERTFKLSHQGIICTYAPFRDHHDKGDRSYFIYRFFKTMTYEQIAKRASPIVSSFKVDEINKNDMFLVNRRLRCSDGNIYLHLLDGTWLFTYDFDDTTRQALTTKILCRCVCSIKATLDASADSIYQSFQPVQKVLVQLTDGTYKGSMGYIAARWRGWFLVEVNKPKSGGATRKCLVPVQADGFVTTTKRDTIINPAQQLPRPVTQLSDHAITKPRVQARQENNLYHNQYQHQQATPGSQPRLPLQAFGLDQIQNQTVEATSRVSSSLEAIPSQGNRIHRINQHFNLPQRTSQQSQPHPQTHQHQLDPSPGYDNNQVPAASKSLRTLITSEPNPLPSPNPSPRSNPAITASPSPLSQRSQSTETKSADVIKTTTNPRATTLASFSNRPHAGFITVGGLGATGPAANVTAMATSTTSSAPATSTISSATISASKSVTASGEGIGSSATGAGIWIGQEYGSAARKSVAPHKLREGARVAVLSETSGRYERGVLVRNLGGCRWEVCYENGDTVQLKMDDTRHMVLANFATCSAMSKKGSRCMLPPIRGMPHCIHHATREEKVIYNNNQMRHKNTEPQKCAAMLNPLKRCGKYPLKGKLYCASHGPHPLRRSKPNSNNNSSINQNSKPNLNKRYPASGQAARKTKGYPGYSDWTRPMARIFDSESSRKHNMVMISSAYRAAFWRRIRRESGEARAGTESGEFESEAGGSGSGDVCKKMMVIDLDGAQDIFNALVAEASFQGEYSEKSRRAMVFIRRSFTVTTDASLWLKTHISKWLKRKNQNPNTESKSQTQSQSQSRSFSLSQSKAAQSQFQSRSQSRSQYQSQSQFRSQYQSQSLSQSQSQFQSQSQSQSLAKPITNHRETTPQPTNAQSLKIYLQRVIHRKENRYRTNGSTSTLHEAAKTQNAPPDPLTTHLKITQNTRPSSTRTGKRPSLETIRTAKPSPKRKRSASETGTGSVSASASASASASTSGARSGSRSGRRFAYKSNKSLKRHQRYTKLRPDVDTDTDMSTDAGSPPRNPNGKHPDHVKSKPKARTKANWEMVREARQILEREIAGWEGSEGEKSGVFQNDAMVLVDGEIEGSHTDPESFGAGRVEIMAEDVERWALDIGGLEKEILEKLKHAVGVSIEA